MNVIVMSIMDVYMEEDILCHTHPVWNVRYVMNCFIVSETTSRLLNIHIARHFFFKWMDRNGVTSSPFHHHCGVVLDVVVRE